VVLGPTGRNFAAGMSGGIAYVYDPDEQFADRCNMAQVELEPIRAEADALEALDHQGPDLETPGRVDIRHSLDQDDQHILHDLIRRHLRFTGSTVAARLLDDWPRACRRFVKVMPVDYRRALREIEEAQRERAREVAHG